MKWAIFSLLSFLFFAALYTLFSYTEISTSINIPWEREFYYGAAVVNLGTLFAVIGGLLIRRGMERQSLQMWLLQLLICFVVLTFALFVGIVFSRSGVYNWKALGAILLCLLCNWSIVMAAPCALVLVLLAALHRHSDLCAVARVRRPNVVTIFSIAFCILLTTVSALVFWIFGEVQFFSVLVVLIFAELFLVAYLVRHSKVTREIHEI